MGIHTGAPAGLAGDIKMKRLIFLALWLLMPVTAQALGVDVALKGSFHVLVDDGAIIYINGTEAYRCGGKAKSPELALKPGDRIVVRLHNIGGPRQLVLCFASTDKTQVVSFQRQSFKLLPDPEAMDFLDHQFPRLPRYPRDAGRKAIGIFPFKHSSDFVWGDIDDCALGSIVTKQMIGPWRYP